LARDVMKEAATRQGAVAERMSFIDAYRWLCEMRIDELPELAVNPDRAGRFELACESDGQTSIR
jgi:hypothetical protein